MSLPLKQRLPLRFERQRIDKSGTSIYSSLFTLVRADSPEGIETPRFAVLVSKKVSNTAVTRNKLKRQVLSVLSHLSPSLPPADYLIIPKRAAVDSTYDQIASDLKKLLKV